MKDHDKNKQSSYIQYWNENSLHGWEVSQKIPVNNFSWIQDTSDEEYFLEVDVQYTKKLHEVHNDLPFLPERRKIEKI